MNKSKNSKNCKERNKKTHISQLTSQHSGITLVALVVTIIVLLILAGVTITVLMGDNGIIRKAQEAVEGTNTAVEDELQGMNDLENKMNSILGGTGTGGDNIIKIPEGLDVGSTVSYNPSGTYEWKAEYATSFDSTSEDYTTNTTTLSSTIGESFNISSWKVLSIDESSGVIELVPGGQTLGTVRLHGAQGYNNGVKLLNDVCSNLYGNEVKGIRARSINIEDIEKYMTETGIEESHNYTNTDSNTTYGNQINNAYTAAKFYPVIYAQEKRAVINGTFNGDNGLDLSEQNTLIERTEGTSKTSNIGLITTGTSIQPYQTLFKNHIDNVFMDYTKKDTTTESYRDLIVPNRFTRYWIASRCVASNTGSCDFGIYVLDFISASTSITAMKMADSGYIAGSATGSLFPIVTLPSNIIKGNAVDGFKVQ